MRLRRLDLTRYGKFTGHALYFGERRQGRPDFHIVYGLNEAGKSTAFSAYLDLLYGIEERSRYGFLHAYNAMEVGAALEFDGQLHEFRRIKQRSNSLRDATGQPVGEALLGGALTGLSREAYRLMFSLDDQTLEDGGNAILDSKGDLGELLFSASAGLAGLSRSLAAIASEADGIFRKRASSTEIAVLKRRLQELKTERDAIDVQASTHAVLVVERDRAAQAYDEAAVERGTLKARQDELDGQMRAAPLAAEHLALGERLAEMEALPRPPSHWSAQLPALMTTQARLSTTLTGLDERRERLDAEIEAIAVDQRLLRLSDRIAALVAEAARFRGAAIDLPKRQTALREVEARLQRIAASITGPGRSEAAEMLVLDAATLMRLRSLLERWSGLEATRVATAAELATAEITAERASEELALPEQAHPPLNVAAKAVLQTLTGRIRETDLPARRRVAESAVQNREIAQEEALASLGPWAGSADDLARLPLPTLAEIGRWREQLLDLERRAARHIEQGRAIESERVEAEAKLAAAQSSLGAIGDEEASALRQERERAWAAHRNALTAESADSFEKAMQAVDAVAEARFAAVDRLAGLRDLRRDLGVFEAREKREAELLAAAEAETATLALAVDAACPPGLGAASSSLAERIARLALWAERRERALATASELRSARTALAQIDASLDGERAALEAALTDAGLAAQGLALAPLLAATDAHLAADAARLQAREMAERSARESRRVLETRRKAADAAEVDIRNWVALWDKALSASWLAEGAPDREAVSAILDPLAALPAALAERDEIRHRIVTMEADQASYLAELAALRAELGEAGGDLSAEAATELTERRGAAQRALALRMAKEAERAEVEQARQVALADKAQHEAARTEITAFFGVSELSEVAERLEACANRARMEAERDKLAAGIVRETSAPSLEAAFERLHALEAGERARLRAEGSRRLDDLDERLQTLFAARSTAEDRLKAIGGDDAVLRIESEKRITMLDIEEKAMRFLQLRTGALLAERALETYRDKHRGSMMQRASDAFRAMTCDAYAGLATRPEKDRDTLIGLSEGGSKLAVDMSKGTRFQLYLALRLASYAEFAATRQPVPFVADDIMETFDEPRSEQVLAQFGMMAMTGQVIYLTHHRHICELARKAVPEVQVHELGSSTEAPVIEPRPSS
ncbi:YhaN family protein [Bosea sp. (in: a-proteobacteria)]|uniref:ATP-binding protein n=1 Tax=Bosea sp. (in: a-proteobacteria) TaxID=1871050 RepID=UPI001AD14AAC|nr:YhaN family protein [Bosea sp. (in: a-proteobacteria)]MBN9438478.1 AAA family ATPase [Bosea sp. (in: a-proteobacteria)]